MPLKEMYVDFADCVVQTKAGTQAKIPAGRHLVVENQTAGGGATIIWRGSQIDINYEEWKRLDESGLTRAV